MQIEIQNKSGKYQSRIKERLSRRAVFYKLQALDFVRTRGMRVLSWVRFAEFILLTIMRSRKSLRYLMEAHRFYPGEFVARIFRKNRAAFVTNLDSLVEDALPTDLDMVAFRSIILKNPALINGQIEKGVLLITFTEAFPFFNKYVDCELLLKYYHVVLEPSWSGYCNPNILFWTKFNVHPIIIESSEQKDFSFINALNSNLIPVEFGASDWVDYRLFHPIPGTRRKYDAIYVCTYKPIKRHHILFKAIRKIHDPSYRVALVCAAWGGTRSSIEHMIEHYGVRNNVILHENCSPQRVNELLNESKVNVLLSLKEGSNRSIFEGMFSNIPCIVLQDNIGVNKKYINEMTGQLICEQNLDQSLLHFRTQWDRYSPREWALNNISPLVTTKKLAYMLRDLSHQYHEPWTTDIVPKVNSPEVSYFTASDKQRFPDTKDVITLFLKERVKNSSGCINIGDSLLKMRPAS